MTNYGAQDMVSPLLRVIARAPAATMAEADSSEWHYGAGLTRDALDSQHREFVARLAKSGAEIISMDDTPGELCDAVFTHDPSLVSNAGTVLLRMGKVLRRGEAPGTVQILLAQKHTKHPNNSYVKIQRANKKVMCINAQRLVVAIP